MRRIVFFSINSITAIPVFRLMLNGLNKSGFDEIKIYECFLPQMSARFSFPYRYVDLLHFDTVASFNNQTVGHKIKKYVKSIFLLFKIIKNNTTLYTCDLEVLALAGWIKNVKRSNCSLVYQQFEAIERSNLNFVKRLAVRYLTTYSETIDLGIFPEVNRMKLFCALVNNNTLNTFVFPNTCYPKKDVLIEAGNKFVIGHIGNISADAFYLSNLLEAVAFLQSDAVELIFVGVKSEVTKAYILTRVPSAIIIGWLNHDELKSIYQKLDLGLILYKPLDFNTDYCAPNKMYEYWSYGVPVLAPKLKGLLGLFDTTVKGILANFEETNEVTEAINLQMARKNTMKKEELIVNFEANLSVQIFIDNLEKKLRYLDNG